MKVRTIKRVTFKEYEAAVRFARQFINHYEKVRWKICEAALNVCDTSYGGRKVKGIYSLAKFADDIGLDRKTLYQWIRVKIFVVDKLPAIELKDQSKYNYTDLADVSEKVNKDCTKQEVLMVWRAQLAQPRESKKFIKYSKHLNALLYNAQRPLQLQLVDLNYIEEIISKCELIAKLLKKEIELRKKFSIEQRLTARDKKIDSAVKDIRDEIDSFGED